MADFAHSVGDFEPLGKQKERRRGLLADLLGIISCHAYRKFGVTVDVETVDAEFSDQNKLEYAGHTVVRLVENTTFGMAFHMRANSSSRGSVRVRSAVSHPSMSS